MWRATAAYHPSVVTPAGVGFNLSPTSWAIEFFCVSLPTAHAVGYRYIARRRGLIVVRSGTGLLRPADAGLPVFVALRYRGLRRGVQLWPRPACVWHG